MLTDVEVMLLVNDDAFADAYEAFQRDYVETMQEDFD